MCAMLSLTPLALVSSHFDLSIACPDHAPYPPDLDQKVHDIRRSASAHQQHPIIAHSASGIRGAAAIEAKTQVLKQRKILLIFEVDIYLYMRVITREQCKRKHVSSDLSQAATALLGQKSYLALLGRLVPSHFKSAPRFSTQPSCSHSDSTPLIPLARTGSRRPQRMGTSLPVPDLVLLPPSSHFRLAVSCPIIPRCFHT